MEKASEVLYALKPASFPFDKEYDATQDACLWPDRRGSGRGDSRPSGARLKGQPESVRYEQVLLNEFLKEHRKGQEQQQEIDFLKAELREQRYLIQKVSAKVR